MNKTPFNKSVSLSPEIEKLNAKRLFVFAESRSGSTWLINTLNSHPEISILDEVLNPDFVKNFNATRVPGDSSRLKGSFQFIESYLAPLPGKFAGCKILFPQAVRFMDFYEFMVNYRKSYFILLFRKNSVKAEVSDIIANKHSRWHLTKSREKQLVSVDPRFLYERLIWRKYAGEFCSNMLKAYAENLIIFEYEDFFTDILSSLNKISSFLNISNHDYQHSQEVKSNPFPLRDLVFNYQECQDFFRDKPEYFDMFSERS